MPEPVVAAAQDSWRWSIAPEGAAALRSWELDRGAPALARARLLGSNDGRRVSVLVDPSGVRPPLYLKWFASTRERAATREAARLLAFAARGQRVAPLPVEGLGPGSAGSAPQAAMLAADVMTTDKINV